MFGFQYLAGKEKYGDNIRTGRYALNPSDNMRYLFRRLSMGYQTPINLTVPSVRTVDRLVRAVSRQLMIDSLDISPVSTVLLMLYSNGIYPRDTTLPFYS